MDNQFIHGIECDLDEDCTCGEKLMLYALDKDGLWHSSAVNYPGQVKTSCCNKKLACTMFVTNIKLEVGQQKCPDLINKEKKTNFSSLS
jgi:hypothetical protein